MRVVIGLVRIAGSNECLAQGLGELFAQARNVVRLGQQCTLLSNGHDLRMKFREHRQAACVIK